MTTLDTARLAEGLREQTARFARAVTGGDPDARVPTCPEWRLRDLAGHVGHAHRWAAELVREAAPVPIADPATDDPGPLDAWARWLRDGAEEVIGAVQEAPAGARVWSLTGPTPPVFWLRRMLGDTVIHHYDAAATTGASFDVAGDLAADVISEGMGLLAVPAAAEFRPELAELRGRGETIVLRPDSGQGWMITRTPDGIRCDRGGGDGDVVVSGSVTELMLVFTRRVPPRDVTGDRALLDHWLAHTAF
ncbi:maleylpyruvate isomerase family mycothiol-dependent enzyme [Nonomuraea sp. B1E8]|uniref:maleylpyruvate isomerase family mycothiol-dependent enzyme n=1 Tax=unclassified Nonomuraea TaxID=2593643 RepID=UPI00325C715E